MDDGVCAGVVDVVVGVEVVARDGLESDDAQGLLFGEVEDGGFVLLPPLLELVEDGVVCGHGGGCAVVCAGAVDATIVAAAAAELSTGRWSVEGQGAEFDVHGGGGLIKGKTLRARRGVLQCAEEIVWFKSKKWREGVMRRYRLRELH